MRIETILDLVTPRRALGIDKEDFADLEEQTREIVHPEIEEPPLWMDHCTERERRIMRNGILRDELERRKIIFGGLA